ncbi:TetR/AcrR family transcriptional regulator [Roseibium sp. CAU 1637]|uniref:TetR/AcrR family transcriptional regulator n=1 Tax=Roseibium limicola TaxID=2816037 RepID=A0A939J6H3_9HYPH|nr:TetR/AcrR family transcriptional regulator [Roseibium limicola]MBO0345127.1 TetR/AcrR family transcriptional regulator [Roseibium limicola]
MRTLYKYTPSRDEMVLAALEHRHGRYLSLLFHGLPEEGGIALDTLLDRVSNWMKTEATHGCLFHSAVAAAPNNAKLRHLLERHKADVGQRAAEAVGLPACVVEITVIMEGLTQSWALLGEQALVSAKRLGGLLR